jgi:hypothetical protein
VRLRSHFTGPSQWQLGGIRAKRAAGRGGFPTQVAEATPRGSNLATKAPMMHVYWRLGELATKAAGHQGRSTGVKGLGWSRPGFAGKGAREDTTEAVVESKWWHLGHKWWRRRWCKCRGRRGSSMK